MTNLIQVITAFFGSLGFAILFNIRGNKLFWTAFGGMLAWVFYLLAGSFFAVESMQYFLGALALGIYSEIMARVKKVPTTLFFVVGFIPLIPGSALYMTMNDAFESNWAGCFTYAIQALNTAVSIAGGIVVSMMLLNIYGLWRRRNE